MQSTLIVGFGRAGRGLHWNVLRRLRGSGSHPELFRDTPPVVWDVRPVDRAVEEEGVRVADSLTEARALLDPGHTVVHLCTPPAQRLAVLRELARLGFRQILVEKPLVSDVSELDRIEEVRRAESLRMMVVAHWLESQLTRRISLVIEGGGLGALRRIRFHQHKPRLLRTLNTTGHPTAFDVEMPHSVGVVLRLAGDATVRDAQWGDMRIGSVTVPRMGTARLVLEHTGGVRTEILSDLASPVRQRMIELDFDRGRVVGHYPISEEDDHAHLTVTAGRRQAGTVFRDDSLGRFLLRAYERFASGADLDPDFTLNTRVVLLLDAAKSHCAHRFPAPGPLRLPLTLPTPLAARAGGSHEPAHHEPAEHEVMENAS
jgi:predicted dehydrogenase